MGAEGRVCAPRRRWPAKVGFEAMLRGDGDVVAGLKNKVQAAVSHVVPADVLAEQRTRMAKPGTAPKSG